LANLGLLIVGAVVALFAANFAVDWWRTAELHGNACEAEMLVGSVT
jgi:hypothetical protein